MSSVGGQLQKSLGVLSGRSRLATFVTVLLGGTAPPATWPPLTSQAVLASVGPVAVTLVAKPQVEAAPPVSAGPAAIPAPSPTACPDVEGGARCDVLRGDDGAMDLGILETAHKGRRGG